MTRHPTLTEHHLQAQCVAWFAWQYPYLHGLLFAIPNGGHRVKAQAGKLKAEGVLPGVADIFLALPNPLYHGLFLECKLPEGKQSKEQKLFEAAVVIRGYQYIIFRSVEQFQQIIKQYLNEFSTSVPA